MGKVREPQFLLDVGVEALNAFPPGANIAKMMFVKGMEMRAEKR